MYGRTLHREFSTECPSPITRATVSRLAPAWFFKTAKTVTASPVVVEDVLYVGDWTGTMYALDIAHGSPHWSFQTDDAPGATFGPIVSSAAVGEFIMGTAVRRVVVFGAGPRVYALDAATGALVWDRHVGNEDLDEDPSEVLSSPVISGNTVYVGMDTHNEPDSVTGGERGGLLALNLRNGNLKWKFEPDEGDGCGGMWSSPTLEPDRGLVYMATANCESDLGAWTPYVEAVTALDMDTGAPVWSFQPHEAGNRLDHDFGATPNLFMDPKGRDVLGVGNKDGTYYALDPDDGTLLWSTNVAEPGDAGDDFSIGGFIGSSATYQGRILGATAIGGPPYYHALDGRDGAVVWNGAQAPSYAASAAVNGVVFHGALDSAFRAMDTDNGRLLWSAPLAGPISSGPAVVGDSVYVGSGTSSSDACAKDAGPVFDVCEAFFDDALGGTGGVHAFRLVAPPPTDGPGGLLFSGQGNQLDVYDLSREPPTWEPFIPNAANGGKDLNAQICRLDDTHILLGEDSGQPTSPPGWGVFDISTRTQVGKLVATYPPDVEVPDQYGCAVERDADGDVSRIFVTQVGSGNFSDANGQLIVFFPTSPGFDAVTGVRSAEAVCPGGDCSNLGASDADFCVIDASIRTAGGMAMGPDGGLYVAEAAPHVPPDVPAPGRILRYDPSFPTSPDGCFTRTPSTFIEDPRSATPGAIVAARDAGGNPTGHWYVSSVIFPSAVNEYDEEGTFVRTVLPPGFGTPFGLAVGRDGTLYVADLGVVFDPATIPSNPDRAGFDTRDGEGSVLRVRFSNGLPLPPETLKAALDFPDGLGLVE